MFVRITRGGGGGLWLGLFGEGGGQLLWGIVWGRGRRTLEELFGVRTLLGEWLE